MHSHWLVLLFLAVIRWKLAAHFCQMSDIGSTLSGAPVFGNDGSSTFLANRAVPDQRVVAAIICVYVAFSFYKLPISLLVITIDQLLPFSFLLFYLICSCITCWNSTLLNYAGCFYQWTTSPIRDTHESLSVAELSFRLPSSIAQKN